MKKNLFLVLAFIAFAVSGSAQVYHYYTNSAPWTGNKSYILNAGLNFDIVSRDFGSNKNNLNVNPGLALSFRYEGDKNINERFSWGYQVEFSYLTQGIKYDEPVSGSTKIRHSDLTWWDLGFDLRLSLSYWINDNIELQAAAGVFTNPFFGIKGESYETTATGAEVANSRKDEKGSTFKLSTGVSTMLQAKYFFNENFFLSLNIHDNIGVNFFGSDFDEFEKGSKGGQRGIVMFGIGYKFIR